MKYLKYLQTANDFEQFKNSEDYILPNVSYIVASDTVMYGISKTEEGKYKVLLASKKDISGLTYNAVNLGLPSGRLWADRNVGASNPEDYGTYFAWGETEGFTYEGVKNITAEELCFLMQPLFGDEIELTPDNIDAVLAEIGIDNGDLTLGGQILTSDKAFSYDWSDYFDTADGGNTFNKYAIDKLTVLEASDDAASANMGSDWRMPTQVEMQELIDNTTHIFVDLQGNEFSKEEMENDPIGENNLKGVRFTGSNGNSIFIPASGVGVDSCIASTKFNSYLWLSNLFSEYNNAANCVFVTRSGGNIGIIYDCERLYGMVSRGVK